MNNNLLDYSILPIYYDIHKDKRRFLLETDQSEYWIMFILEDGSFYYEINNVRGVASSGDIVICPPNTNFTRRVISKLLLHYMQFQWISEKNCNNYNLIADGFPNYIVKSGGKNEVISLISQLREANLAMEHNKLWIKHLINHIWFKHNVSQHNICHPVPSLQADPFVRRVKLHLDQIAFTPFNIKEVSKEHFMTPVQLTRKFKSTYNLTPSEYVLNLRMDKAKMLLVETDYTIQHVADLCGYKNGFYFSRVFSKHTGKTPSEYRKLFLI